MDAWLEKLEAEGVDFHGLYRVSITAWRCTLRTRVPTPLGAPLGDWRYHECYAESWEKAIVGALTYAKSKAPDFATEAWQNAWDRDTIAMMR
jgi:hypothetical protein